MQRRGSPQRRLAVSGLVMAVVMAAVAMMPAVAAAQSAASNEVTFTKDVAPILYDSCVVCHRAGEMAPMALTTYAEVRPWARAIKERVVARVMPPWHIDKNIGIQKFKDDISLTDEQIATIATWVDNGTPMGDPVDMPQMPQFPNWSAWQIGEPDLVVRYPHYLVPAEGPDIFGSLRTRALSMPRSTWRRTATSQRSRRGPWTGVRDGSSTTRSRMPWTRTTTT